MSYKLIFARSFTKEFDKLPKSIKEQLLKSLGKAVESPYAGTKLRGKLDGLWRLRVGKYRVVLLDR